MENRTIAKEAEKNHVTVKDLDREKDQGLSLTSEPKIFIMINTVFNSLPVGIL